MINTLASIIFPLITFPYISRVLGPENVGKVNFSSSIVSYFSLIATLGVTVYAVRECSASKENQEKLENTASEILSINIVTMIISYVLLVICLILIPGLNEYSLLITILSLAIYFQVIGANWLNTSMEDFGYITVRTVAFQFVSLILMFIFVHEPGDYIIYAIITLVASSAGQILNVFYRRRYGKIHFVKKMNWKKHLPPIIGLFSMLLSQNVMNNIDQTMLGFMRGDYEVGLYSVPYKIISIVMQVVASITWVLLPQLTNAFNNKDYPSINRILNKALNFTYTLTFPCFVGLVVLSKEIVIIVGGIEYIPAVSCLMILAIGMVVDLVWGNLWGNCVLLPEKREKQFTFACFVAMIVNIIADYFLIPLYGINGAALATVVAKIIIVVIVIQKKNENIKIGLTIKSIFSPLAGSILITIVCFAIKMLNLGTAQTLVVSIVISVLVYAISMIMFKNELVIEYLSLLKSKFLR